ncbi:MAG: ligand-binding sensor domain-containing protein, partial [Brevundimonas sp.]
MAGAGQGASAIPVSAAAHSGRRLSRVVAIFALVMLSCVHAALALAASPSPTPPVFQTIADARAVPNGVITALAEDTDGLIWVGSTNGLLRFDGQRVLHESDRSPVLPRAFVQSLHASADGRLWVGLQGFGVWWRDPATGAFVRLPPPGDGSTHPDSGLTPLAITSDGEGGAWIADARDGARRIDAKGRWVAGLHLMPGESVRAVLVDRGGTLWLGHRGGLMRLDAGAKTLEPVPGFERRYVYALHQARDGRLWVGTQAHGASIIAADGEVRHLPLAPAPGGVGHPWVDGFADWGEGRMWLSTFGGGLEVRDAASG